MYLYIYIQIQIHICIYIYLYIYICIYTYINITRACSYQQTPLEQLDGLTRNPFYLSIYQSISMYDIERSLCRIEREICTHTIYTDKYIPEGSARAVGRAQAPRAAARPSYIYISISMYTIERERERSMYNI